MGSICGGDFLQVGFVRKVLLESSEDLAVQRAFRERQ